MLSTYFDFNSLFTDFDFLPTGDAPNTLNDAFLNNNSNRIHTIIYIGHERSTCLDNESTCSIKPSVLNFIVNNKIAIIYLPININGMLQATI